MLTFPTVSFFLVLSYFRGGGGGEGVAAAGEYAKKNTCVWNNQTDMSDTSFSLNENDTYSVLIMI